MSELNPLEIFSPAQPSESGLLDWLHQHTSRKMIEEIAANDYGEEVSGHFAGIQRQLSNDPLKGLLPRCPREVLELQRYMDPELGSQEQQFDEPREHRKRLLACALLLQSATTVRVAEALSEEEYFLDTQAATLISLIRSALYLGGECLRHSLDFLLWFYTEIEFPRLVPFVSYSAFLLWLEINREHANCATIQAGWKWVNAQETLYRTKHPDKARSKRWLVGINRFENRVGSRERWFATAHKVLERQRGCPEQMNTIRAAIEAVVGRH